MSRLRYARLRYSVDHHRSGGELRVPRTSLERLQLTVKLARLKSDFVRRNSGAGSTHA